MGSYTEHYEGGNFTFVSNARLAGVQGGQPGKQMLADPRPGNAAVFRRPADREDPDVAQVVMGGQHVCVPLRCFDGVRVVLVVREGRPE
ncbi:MAG: hypothetical protein ACR2GZ_05530 [Solirubrobacteraceae bacterium]